MTRLIPVRDVLDENAWFHIDDETNCGFLIDPGADATRLLRFMELQHWTLEAILLTHGHFDHIGAVAEISQRLQIPYYIHLNGEKYLSDPMYNLSAYSREPISLFGATLLKEGDVVRLKANPQFSLRLIHTPGHTTDSSVFINEQQNIAFVGDTIFSEGFGATHFPGGDFVSLSRSIREKILTLPPTTVLCSGHSTEFEVGSWRGENYLI